MTTPPATRRDDDLVEDLHGHRVADPYRWLEGGPAGSGDELRAWVEAQAAAADDHLSTLPSRPWFRRRLERLWEQPRRGAPWRRGAWWFQVRNDGSQDQDVLWCAPAATTDGAHRRPAPDDDRWRVLVDPNPWSEDGTAALSAIAACDDGALVALARSDAGSDWLTWRVVDTATGELHTDLIPWAKFSTAAWLPDASGFVYGAYEPPEEGEAHTAPNRDQQLRLHRLGDAPGDDTLVYARPDQPEWGFGPAVTHDGRWLVVHVWHGTRPETRVHLAPIVAGSVGEVRPLLDEGDARYEVLGVLNDDLIVLTDLDAPQGRVIAVAVDDPTRRRELVAETTDQLDAAQLVGGAGPDDPAWLVCRRLHHATARIAVHDARGGAHLHDIELPDPGTVTELTGGRHDAAVHLTHESFTAPARVLHHDLTTTTTRTITTPSVPGAADAVTEQVHVVHDGVAVPLFLVHRGDVRPDGATPTVLWGYGGFDVPVTPAYRPAWRAWIDAGGLLAVACLRGGCEYGRAWHDDGRLANKQHVFDDARACAAWLTGRDRSRVAASAVTEGADPEAVWTAPDRIGIEGRSNGGLLVGACITQEPQAFASAVVEVGVLDMVRFHRFTIGWAWTSDYGSPDDPDDLAVLLAYSPYHSVRPGAGYPATLVTTGDTDDRVVPAHSYKFAAALQHAQAGPAPVLLRVDIAAGHGAGKPVTKLLDERADVLAFHAHHLGLEVPEVG